jgi:hypothetical protein
MTLTPMIGTPVTPPRGEMALSPATETPSTASASPSPSPSPSPSTRFADASARSAAATRPSSPALPDHAFEPPVAIPTPPESGLLIRQRRPSAAPPSAMSGEDDAMPRITVDGLENLADALASAAATATATPTEPATSSKTATPTVDSSNEPAATATATAAATTTTATTGNRRELPEYVRGKIKFAVLTAELASAGIKARREDGLEKLVKWDEVVGIVARRLPADKPFEGATVVDLLSTAGATLRIVPWTKLDGHPFESKAVERARSFVNVVAAMALDAKLDAATNAFANGDGDAAQLPSVAALATHDSKVG